MRENTEYTLQRSTQNNKGVITRRIRRGSAHMKMQNEESCFF